VSPAVVDQLLTQPIEAAGEVRRVTIMFLDIRGFTAFAERKTPTEVVTYLNTGLVPRFPTAILVTGMTVIAVLCFFAGLILDTVTRGRREVRRLAYLALPAPRAGKV